MDSTSVSHHKLDFMGLWARGHLYIAFATAIYGFLALNTHFGILDWQKEIAYFDYIRNSLVNFHTIPLYFWTPLENLGEYPAIRHSWNFIGNPETMLLSPLTPLIYVLPSGYFIKLVIFVHFLLGLLGVIKLRGRLNWSDLQFRTFVALFLLSPLIIQHLAIGYTPWINLFLFPWLIYFMSDDRFVSASLGAAGVLAIVLLQGATHVFVWFFLFYVVYRLSCFFLSKQWVHLIYICVVAAASLVLSLARVLPTAITYGEFERFFLPGYNPVNFIFWALIPTPPLVFPFSWYFCRDMLFGVPSWDGGMYWGLSLVMSGILVWRYRTWRLLSERRDTRSSPLNWDAVFITSVFFAALAFGPTVDWLTRGLNSILHMPYIRTVERYPFRLMIPAMLGFYLLLGQFSREIWDSLRGLDESLRRIYQKRLFMWGIQVAFYCFLLFGIAYISLVLCLEQWIEALMELGRTAAETTGVLWFSQLSDNLVGHIERGAIFIRLDENIALFTLILGACFLLGLLIWLRGTRQLENASEFGKVGLVEFLLVLPLFWSSLMWLAVAVSTPLAEFARQDVRLPHMFSHCKFSARATPECLTIEPFDRGVGCEYFLFKVPADDLKCLEVSNSSVHSKSEKLKQGTVIRIRSDREGPIKVIYRERKKFVIAFMITLVAWLVCIVTIWWDRQDEVRRLPGRRQCRSSKV